LKDRGFGVFVHRHTGPGAFHPDDVLDGTADTTGKYNSSVASAGLAFARDHFNSQLTVAKCSEPPASLAVESGCVRPNT
jgi:hypothetical protein